MQQAKQKKIARTYRFDAPAFQALKRYQAGLIPPPSETKLVETAILEFVERRERGDAKRAVRR